MRKTSEYDDDDVRGPEAFELRFGLKELFLAILLVSMMLGVTVFFGRPALESLPPVIMICAVYVTVRSFCGSKKLVAELCIIAPPIYLVVSFFGAAGGHPRWVHDQIQCVNNLKRIALALQTYHDDYGSFPPAHIADKNGKPMHSWRVLLLPYLECEDLYDQYDFNEPWDGPNNRKLADLGPSVFYCREDDTTNPCTSYVAVVGPGAVWPGTATTRAADVKDGTSNTIIVVETEKSGIHWMEPRDLDFASMPMRVNPSEGRGISSGHPHDKWDRPISLQAHAAMADGGVMHLPNSLSPSQIRALLTIAGGEEVTADDL